MTLITINRDQTPNGLQITCQNPEVLVLIRKRLDYSQIATILIETGHITNHMLVAFNTGHEFLDIAIKEVVPDAIVTKL